MPDSRPKAIIHTDGACYPNPGGPGGWAAIIHRTDHKAGREKLLSGGEDSSTNNRMELTAVIRALEFLPVSYELEIVTDSQYVINPFAKGWVEGWRARGWRKADGNPVLNADLIEQLDRLVARHIVRWTWIRGHNEHPLNEQCDRMAVAERLKRTPAKST